MSNATHQPSNYTVRLNIFEGPLDLLLHLIKNNEMEITEIALSEITGQYLDYLRLMETLDLEVAGDFLVVAATLLNIKLRSLLPAAPEEQEETEEAEIDNYLSARELMQKLIEYRRFKEASAELGRRAEDQALVFYREVALPTLAAAEAEPEVRGDLAALLEAFAHVIQFVDRRDYHQVKQEEYLVEDKITLVRQRLFVESQVLLSELFSVCANRVEMVVTLLALLELCRLKELRVSQADNFGELIIFPRRGDDAKPRTGEAEELRRQEADIIAQRTGLVDDGELPEDDEDAMLRQVLGEEEPRASQVTQPEDPPAEEEETSPPARVIDLNSDLSEAPPVDPAES